LAEKSHFFHDAKNDVRKLSHASGMPTFSNIEFAILVLTETGEAELLVSALPGG